MSKNFVLKVGGSLLYDNYLNINYELLDALREWFVSVKAEYEKLAIVIGGGKLSRDIQSKITRDMEEKYLHNIGMSLTQTNAALLQGFLGDSSIVVPNTLGEAYEILMGDGKCTLVTGGLKSGWSTDMDAVVFADILNLKMIVKLSDIEYLYSADPKNNPEAQPIKDITWSEYFKMFNISEDFEHSPNMKMPIDGVSANFCKRKGISVFLCGGKNLSDKYVLQDVFKEGSLIHP